MKIFIRIVPFLFRDYLASCYHGQPALMRVLSTDQRTLNKQPVWNCLGQRQIVQTVTSCTTNVLIITWDISIPQPTSKRYLRDDSRFEPSQWETALFCNNISHWPGASLESSLCFVWGQIEGLVQERRNSSASAMELCLSCTNPWKLWSVTKTERSYPVDRQPIGLFWLKTVRNFETS